MRRRSFFRSVCASAAVFTFDQLVNGLPLRAQFINVARDAGLRTKTIFGGESRNRYLLETTGCGVAFYDYDHDGWLDIFLVNGSRFETTWGAGDAPVSRLYKNNRDGTFTDVTLKAGIGKHGWGQGCCVGDFDNDDLDDLFVTYWGKCSLWKNRGDGTFTDVAAKAGVQAAFVPGSGGKLNRWNTGCAFVDYDRDGNLDLFVANYIDFDIKTVPVPESGKCLFKGMRVACGPPGLKGGRNALFRNNGDGTFRDVSEQAGIWKTPGTYGLGVIAGDFNNDGWPDIYVANDSTSSALYRNNKDGTFTDIAIEAGAAYSPDGKSQAGMGVSVADYDHDGQLDIVKTNFQGDTSSLYRNSGNSTFEDQTFQSGLGRNTRFMGWGAGFLDTDNDGHPDILLTNGHVYPEVGSNDEMGYRERKVLYRNLGNGRFEDVSLESGPGILERVTGRGCAFGDFDNDGDMDVVVNCINDFPQLLRCDRAMSGNWIKVRCIGTKSNRSAIGARVTCRAPGLPPQMDEVRSGGSYLSQNDLRLHFGVAAALTVELEIRWPDGDVETVKGSPVNQVITVREGQTRA
ncbi:MAG: CRTAC1 family protein [Bryobacteraceae bacterium]|nr:CRTAC1 family protein [Bryobacteraceae bacterium]